MHSGCMNSDRQNYTQQNYLTLDIGVESSDPASYFVLKSTLRISSIYKMRYLATMHQHAWTSVSHYCGLPQQRSWWQNRCTEWLVHANGRKAKCRNCKQLKTKMFLKDMTNGLRIPHIMQNYNNLFIFRFIYYSFILVIIWYSCLK